MIFPSFIGLWATLGLQWGIGTNPHIENRILCKAASKLTTCPPKRGSAQIFESHHVDIWINWTSFDSLIKDCLSNLLLKKIHPSTVSSISQSQRWWKVCPKFQVLSSGFPDVIEVLNEHWALNEKCAHSSEIYHDNLQDERWAKNVHDWIPPPPSSRARLHSAHLSCLCPEFHQSPTLLRAQYTTWKHLSVHWLALSHTKWLRGEGDAAPFGNSAHITQLTASSLNS